MPTNCTTDFISGFSSAQALTRGGSRSSVFGNQEIDQGKNFSAYSKEVVAVKDIIWFSTAMGMAAMMTGSGTGPRATRELCTILPISTTPFCGIQGGVHADDLHRLAENAAGLVDFLGGALRAPVQELADRGDGPVRELRKGISHCSTLTFGPFWQPVQRPPAPGARRAASCA